MELRIDEKLVEKARSLSTQIVSEVMDFIYQNSTAGVERAVLMLMGLEGENEFQVPYTNVVVNHLLEKKVLSKGAAYWVANAMQNHGLSIEEVAIEISNGKLDLTAGKRNDLSSLLPLIDKLALQGTSKLSHRREERTFLKNKLGQGKSPLLYVIVATGDIYEDALQAQAGVRQGADIVAVIRHTGQSLLDFVPQEARRGGVGGTYANRENFSIMRQAMDEVGGEVGRYIYLTNYCSGLCMAEMAALGGMERLDIMLNDSMYGIIFRDINMKRTFIDQYFSRLVNAYSGIIINTGEDNYLTTADAFEKAHTVVSSQFINERFALESGLKEEQIGLGHAYEINPGLKNSFLWELAQAQLVRQLFPRSPIKYMPPTKYMTGNIFKGHTQNTMFNMISALTGQSIHLLGMLTEALHTPHLQDRYLSLENAKYVFSAMEDLGDEISIRRGGLLEKRASLVLEKAVDLLEEIASLGLMEAINQGMFADISRSPAGGKGGDGVFAKGEDYYNPFIKLMRGKEG